MTGKARRAIAEFGFGGTMYKDVLKLLEWNFWQPQAVVSVCMDELNLFPPLKLHNSEYLISYSATTCALIRVFRPMHYHQDLSNKSFLGEATQKLPPNSKEALFMHTAKRNGDRPIVFEFNDWLKDKAEAHEKMNLSWGKFKTKSCNPSAIGIRTKTGTRFFSSTSWSQKPSMKSQGRKSSQQLCCL